MKGFNPASERCPFCGAIGNCRIFASYNRYIIDFVDNKVVSDILSVRRVLCTCGHTPAILPDFIIPYRQYSLPFILMILRAWFTHAMTQEKILSVYGVSHKVLKKWRDIYEKHKDLWLGIVQSSRVSSLAFLKQILSLDPFSAFTNGFYLKTLYSFLQSHANPANCRQHPPSFFSS